MPTRRRPNDVARPVERSALLLSPNQRSAPEETDLHANPKIITLHRSNGPLTRQRPPLIAGTSRTFPPLLTGSPSSWPHTRARFAPASCTLWHSRRLPIAVERAAHVSRCLRPFAEIHLIAARVTCPDGTAAPSPSLESRSKVACISGHIGREAVTSFNVCERATHVRPK